MENKQFYFKDPNGKLQRWWEELQEIGENPRKRNMRGERAILRRAETPTEVMLSPLYYEVSALLKDIKGENALALAIAVGILSHVRKKGVNGTFATQLGTPKEGSTKPVMSELRFQQLVKSNNPEEFYRRLIRAVHLLGKSANIMSLVENIFHWVKEHKFGKSQNPQKSLVVQWAGDYFQAISNIKK